MATLERNYIIPLRKEWRKAPSYKRSKKAISALKAFLIKHMKAKEVKIGKELNQHIFSRGYKNPPHKVHVTVIKEDDVAKVNIYGIPYKEFKIIKEEKKEGLADKLKSKLTSKEGSKEEDKEEIKIKIPGIKKKATPEKEQDKGSTTEQKTKEKPKKRVSHKKSAKKETKK